MAGQAVGSSVDLEASAVPANRTDEAPCVAEEKALGGVPAAEVVAAELPNDDAGKAGGPLWAAWANLVVTCMGSTIVVLPVFVEFLGFAGTGLVILLPATLSAMAMRMLVHLADVAWEGRDYVGVIREYLGWRGDWVAFVASVLYLPPVDMIAFSVEVVPRAVMSVSPLVACCLAVAIATPFTCLTSLERLSKASALGLAAILYSVGVIAAQSFVDGRHSLPVFVGPPAYLYFIIVAKCINAFGGAIAVVSLYSEVSAKERKRFVLWVVDGGLATIFATYMSVAAVAYVLYGDDLQTNVLLNLSGSVWASFARGAVVVSNALRAPLFCVLFYAAIASKFPDTFKRAEGNRLARPAFQMACLMVSGALALGLSSVGTVIAIFGGTAGVALLQVLPSLAWLQARRDRRVQRRLHLDVAACFMAVVAPMFSVAFLVSLGIKLNGQG